MLFNVYCIQLYYGVDSGNIFTHIITTTYLLKYNNTFIEMSNIILSIFSNMHILQAYFIFILFSLFKS